MLVGWGILSPLSKLSGWAPGPVGDMTTGARGWILWTSLAIMCVDSVVSLIPVISEYVTKIVRPRGTPQSLDGGADNKDDHEVETEDRLVPNNWVMAGLGISVMVGTVLVWVVFGNDGIKPWATLLGFVMGGMLSVLGSVHLHWVYCPPPLTSFQCTCLGRNRSQPSQWPGQDLAAIFRLDSAGKHRGKRHRGRCS